MFKNVIEKKPHLGLLIFFRVEVVHKNRMQLLHHQLKNLLHFIFEIFRYLPVLAFNSAG
jgi:hypothetical protein